jgi:hypothetical protein
VDLLEKEMWSHANVDLLTATPADYVRRLAERLDAHAPATAAP